MPGGDGSGPMGMGPMSGRGAGYCAGYNVPGYANPMPGWGRGYGGRGRGRGMGRGMGRGWQNRFNAPGMPAWQPGMMNPYPNAMPYPDAYDEIPEEQQLEMLTAQAKQIESALQDIHKRIEELEQKKK